MMYVESWHVILTLILNVTAGELALDNTMISKPTHKTASLDKNRDRSCGLE
jgi:hypothetical protein